MRNQLLSDADFKQVIRLTPLISMDLIIRNEENRVLLGLRVNEPAKDFYFVPGGRIRKDERLSDAFSRILRVETGFTRSLEEARFLGVYEHLYTSNFNGEPEYGTHYVVLGYEICLALKSANVKPGGQHKKWLWWDEQTLLSSCDVHDNAKLYFRVSSTNKTPLL